MKKARRLILGSKSLWHEIILKEMKSTLKKMYLSISGTRIIAEISVEVPKARTQLAQVF